MKGVLEEHFNFKEVIFKLSHRFFQVILAVIDLEQLVLRRVQSSEFVLLKALKFLDQNNAFLFSTELSFSECLLAEVDVSLLFFCQKLDILLELLSEFIDHLFELSPAVAVFWQDSKFLGVF